MPAAAPVALSSSDVEFENPQQAPSASFSIPTPGLKAMDQIASKPAAIPSLSSSDVEFEHPAEPASDVSRFGKSVAQQSGVPTSMEELKAAQPSLAEEIGGPAVTAGKMAWNYGKNLVKEGGAAAGEVSDAYHNIKEGQPVGENIGKVGAAASDFALKGILVPVGGTAVAQAGQDFSQGKIPEALGDVTAAVPQVMGARSLIKGAPAAKPLAATEDIAGTKMPLTVGQALTKANPTGVGPTVQGLEDLSRQLPFSDGLKSLARGQQAGAREILGNKAEVGGAETATAPENIEQNFSNAAEQARQQGKAKYTAIAQAADKADLSEPTAAAASILTDPDIAKVLPKSTRDALGKVAQGMTEREGVARQIYGKAFGELDEGQQAEVGKAMGGSAEPKGMQAILDARSELSSAANGARDANDARLLHGGLSQYDEAVDRALQGHDKAAGTNLVSDLKDARQLWTQKYAFETFRDGLQQVMNGVPSEGTREIPGQKFMEFVNGLDPQGGADNSTLHKMFPGDEQSVADIHKLADFMGKNQAHAGGMSGTMARMRILGLKGAGLLANSTGFAWAMSKPGFAGKFLQALQAGKNTVKAAAAIGAMNHLLADAPEVPENSELTQPKKDDATVSDQPTAANTAVKDQPTTSTNATAKTKNNAIPSATSNITPPPNNATTQNKWVARAIDSAKLKNAQKPQGSGQDVQSNGTLSPPKSHWDGKESKTLTLKHPETGKSQRWKLRNGTPILAE